VKDDEFKLHDDTVRNLEVLAHAPGDLKFRLALANSIHNIHRAIELNHAAAMAEIKRLQDRKFPSEIRVAQIAAKEFAPIKRDVKELRTLVKWIVGTFLGTLIIAATTVYVTRALHEPERSDPTGSGRSDRAAHDRDRADSAQPPETGSGHRG
jgi:hypothetical protein